MQFKILFLGEHTNHDFGDSYGIDPLTSSVSLLSDGTTHVLFDSGSLAWQDKLVEELAKLDLKPDDITHVMLTHYHLDHTANCILFKNAEIHCNRSLINHKNGKCTIYRDIYAKPMPLDISVFPTPGHTEDHVSYFFEFDGKRYCIAGDAVREDLIENGAPHYYEEERQQEFLASMKNIFEFSDVIIPGHFGVIEGPTKDKFQAMLAK